MLSGCHRAVPRFDIDPSPGREAAGADNVAASMVLVAISRGGVDEAGRGGMPRRNAFPNRRVWFDRTVRSLDRSSRPASLIQHLALAGLMLPASRRPPVEVQSHLR